MKEASSMTRPQYNTLINAMRWIEANNKGSQVHGIRMIRSDKNLDKNVHALVLLGVLRECEPGARMMALFFGPEDAENMFKGEVQ